MDRNLEINVLEIKGGHNVPLPDRPQNQGYHLHLELFESNMPADVQEINNRTSPC